MSIKLSKHKLTGVNIPTQLQEIPSPPKEIFIVGDLIDRFHELMSRPRIAIVGSRKVTPYGRTVTEQLAKELVQQGVIIVSGLALGVDGIAHRAVLEANGDTIAVLPCGIDEIYPRTHIQLAKQLLEKGNIILSEYPGSYPPRRENFIARNRLVAGIADGVLITEAAEKSGTIHTVNFALEQGKPVFAVPGNITSPMSRGCNHIIKTGAIPVTEVDDILDELGLNHSTQTELFIANSPEEQTLVDLIQQGITDGSDLLAKSSLSPQVFNQTLSLLEISGTVKPLGNNHWTLK